MAQTDGTNSLVVAAHDTEGLQRVATLTGTRISYVRGLETAFLAIPFSGATNVTVGGLATPVGGVAHTDRDMSPGVPSDCIVCWCTDTGLECWDVCNGETGE